MSDFGQNPFGVLSYPDDHSDKGSASSISSPTLHPTSNSNLSPLVNTVSALSAGDSKEDTLVSPGSVASDEQADMPAGGKRVVHPPRREADFSSLLTHAEKLELVSLVNKITDGMQKQFCQTFASASAHDHGQTSRPSFWDKLPAHLRDFSLANNSPQRAGVTLDSKEDPRGKGNSQQSRPKPGLSRSQPKAPANDLDVVPLSLNANATDDITDNKEGQQPILQELRKEFLTNFRKWQGSVARRVNDISVKGGKHGNRGRQVKRGPASAHNIRVPVAPKTCMTTADENMRKFYPPMSNSLGYLPMEKKKLILHAVLLLVLSLDHYNAYSRTLMFNLTSSLHIPIHVLLDDELRIAKALAETISAIEPTDWNLRRAEEVRGAKKWKSGAAGGGASTSAGGLPMSLLSAGIGAIPSGLTLGTSATAGVLAAMAGTTFVVAALFGLCVARPSGKPMEQLAKEIPEFALRPVHDASGQDTEFGRIEPRNRRLRVVLGISGWLKEDDDIGKPWRALGGSSEVYSFQWDPEALTKLGNALETVLKSAAWSLAKKEIIARTMRTSLDEGAWPNGLLKMSKAVDNPWIMGMVRADKTGCTLAEMIMNKAHGERSITLIGYSLGARVIYTCLMNLAEKRAFGLVENAILMGTPAPSGPLVWGTMKSVVSTRLVNVYSENDYILGFLYRTSALQYGIAGLQQIGGVDGVENVNVTAKVSGHLRYQYLVGSILDHIGWEDIDKEVVAVDEKALADTEKRSRERGEKRDAVELNPEGPAVAEVEPAKGEEKEPEGIIRTRIKKKRKGKGRK